MSKITRKLAPPVRLRELLSESKRAGIPFDEAWDLAMAQMTREKAWPHNTEARAEWKAIIEAGREQWRCGYENVETRATTLIETLRHRDEAEEIVAADDEVIGALVLA